MPISVLSAAKRLASQGNWSLSNLELQKIIFLAHMFYMGRNNGDPLVAGLFEAWDFGPVHPTLYHRAKVFGSDPVENVFHDAPDLEDGLQRSIIDEACEALSAVGPGRLVSATHKKGGAWDRNYIPGARNIIIPNEDVLDEYNRF